ncbi:recombinase family protein [Nocardia sp. 2YAB30]|uniref:recombinase family protein n=1 Tax=unclassified Nocardia TaxID=2637762 RepID=UPI003F984B17
MTLPRTRRRHRRFAMTRYGYARVSTRDQFTDHQVNALRAAGIADEHMFIEKFSGKLVSCA